MHHRTYHSSPLPTLTNCSQRPDHIAAVSWWLRITKSPYVLPSLATVRSRWFPIIRSPSWWNTNPSSPFRLHVIPSNSMSPRSWTFPPVLLSPMGPVAISTAGDFRSVKITAAHHPIYAASSNSKGPREWTTSRKLRFKSAVPLNPRIQQPWHLWGTRGHDSYVVLQACVTCVFFDGSLYTHAVTAPKPLQAGQPRTTGS